MFLKKRLVRHLYVIYLSLIVVALGGFGLYAHLALKKSYLAQVEDDLHARARFVEAQVDRRWSEAEYNLLDAWCKDLGSRTSTRISLILPNGRVVADSDEDVHQMDDHSFRPEIKVALGGQTASSVRFSRTLQQRMMYYAVPVSQNGEVVGVVRTAIPVHAMDQVLQRLRRQVFSGAFLMALVTAIMSFVAYRRMSRPLIAMKEGAERFAGGQLDYRLAVPDSGQLGGLAVAFNDMAAQLKERIDTIVRQRSEQEALLSAMVESVLAVDMEGRLISMNQAAAKMFRVELAQATGRFLQEIVRTVDLQNFLKKARETGTPIEEDVVVFTEEEQYLQAHGTLLRDAQGRKAGVLIVLNDVTRLKRLENVRREFFANVSHELKTPITSIKASVETLQDGKPHDDADVERFLGVIARQSDRLNNLVEDLLAISRLEHGEAESAIELKGGRLAPLLQAAVQTSRLKAQERGVVIELTCDPELEANFNGRLLEQAIQNLIDNAIKYSEEGTRVKVEGAQDGSEILIRVIDQGIGIPREHLSRLFERFYRVDRARSRSLGGTGLGLAIVKHIAQAHGGRVMVDSAPDKGSTFTIVLPLASS
ncbi:MAG: ATP-binding protein [bacterium]|nr:ATP-binding protein [bacterium]